MSTPMSVELYNAWFCPFAQRAWIALVYKGVPFTYVEQDPYDKSPDWLAVNPRGLVPTIVHNGRSVYESAVCIEYVDEAWPHKPYILPRDPFDRALVRIWSDHITKKIVPPFYGILMKETDKQRDEQKEELLKQVLHLTQAMSDEGPFFMGLEFGMVDIMLAPHAIRFDQILKEYRGFSVPENELFSRFHKWMAAVMDEDCVKATLQPRDKLVEKYKRYADNTAETEVADAIRSGKTLP